MSLAARILSATLLPVLVIVGGLIGQARLFDRAAALDARAALAASQKGTLERLTGELDAILLQSLLAPDPRPLLLRLDTFERDSMHRLGVLDEQTETELSHLLGAEREEEEAERDRPAALRATLEAVIAGLRDVLRARLAADPVPAGLSDLLAAERGFADLIEQALADEAAEIARTTEAAAGHRRAGLAVVWGGAAIGAALAVLLGGGLARRVTRGLAGARAGLAGDPPPAGAVAGEFGRLDAQARALRHSFEARAEAAEAARLAMVAQLDRRSTELELSNARLREIDATRRRFVADIGHALKTPLAVARGSVENIGLGGPPAGIARALDAIDAVTERVAALVTLAQSEDGRLTAPVSEIELAEFLDTRIAALRILPGGERFVLNVDLDGPAMLRCGRQDLERLCDAVLENALDHGGQDGPIEVRLRAGDGRIAIEVTDRGPGLGDLPPDSLFQRHRSGRGGTGIGLAMARQIAGELGGGIALATPAAGGLRVTIDLPARG